MALACNRTRANQPRLGLDFVHHRTYDGKAYRMLTAIDEYTRECLAIVAARKLSSGDMINTLADLFIQRGAAAHISFGQWPRAERQGDTKGACSHARQSNVHRAP